MSKRSNHDGRAAHRAEKDKIKAKADNVIDLDDRRLLKEAGEALDGIVDLANDAAAAGRPDILEQMLDEVGPLSAKLSDKWYCDQCHVAVTNKERCKHCGKTENDKK